MRQRALLIIDMQNGVFGEGAYPQTAPAAIAEIARGFREKGEEVVYVCQTDDDYPEGSRGWRVIDALTPQPGERVFTKRHNSAFKDTGLADYLRTRGVGEVVVCGAVTQYCINATAWAALEHGFAVDIPEGANAAYAAEGVSAEAVSRLFNRNIWNGSF